MLGKFVAAAGFEVEGPWRSPPPMEKKLIRDFKEESFNHPVSHPELVMCRECVSEPLRYHKTVDEFFEHIRPHFIEAAVGEGMGFHIHVSFQDKKFYDILFTKNFIDTYLKALAVAFKGDTKLEARPNYRSPSGTNFYVMQYPNDYFLHGIDKKNHRTDRKERYYVINYRRAYSDHGTFEFRIYPANTIDQMKKYALFTIEFINTYISSNIDDDTVTINANCIPSNPERVEYKKISGDVIQFIMRNEPRTKTTKLDDDMFFDKYNDFMETL